MTGNEGDLLSRFRAGERDAVVAVARLARGVVGHRGHYIPRGEREDLVQEVVVQAYRAVIEPSFRPSKAFEAFVRSVAQRRCVDWVRHNRPSESLDPHTRASNPDPEHQAIDREQRSRARAALAALGYSCRSLIRLRVKDGLSYAEIARRLGRSEVGVRSQMYKCLKRAREWLNGVGSAVRSGNRDEA
jgi:RNA polymerase sigma factor (sigma-70 family)